MCSAHITVFQNLQVLIPKEIPNMTQQTTSKHSFDVNLLFIFWLINKSINSDLDRITFCETSHVGPSHEAMPETLHESLKNMAVVACSIQHCRYFGYRTFSMWWVWWMSIPTFNNGHQTMCSNFGWIAGLHRKAHSRLLEDQSNIHSSHSSTNHLFSHAQIFKWGPGAYLPRLLLFYEHGKRV